MLKTMLTGPIYPSLPQLPCGFRAVFLDAPYLLCRSLEQANNHVFVTDMFWHVLFHFV